MTTVLLLGAGGAAANSVARCLRGGDWRIVGANADPYALAMAEADEVALLPRVGDEGYHDALGGLIRRHGADIVHAQPEEQVLDLAELRSHVPGADMLPPATTLRLCADKFFCYTRWAAAGLRVPRTFLVGNVIELVDAMRELGGRVWLRARSGAGGAGSLATQSRDEAVTWVERHDGWGDFTAAEILTPRTTCFQSLWHTGRLVAAQSKIRLRWANARNVPSGIGGSAGVSETISDPAVTEIATAAILAVDPAPHGLFGVDMAYDEAGIPNPTEINAGRFFTTVDFFAAAGFNLPDLYFRLALGEGAPPEPVVNPLRDGLLWIREMDRAPVLMGRETLDLLVGAQAVAA
jgi:carbamoyl-phosphate synthase large subunit